MKNQVGFSLLEVLISIAILGTIGATFLAAVGTSSQTVFIADKRDTAQRLAESEMEWVKRQIYAPSYTPPASPVEYAGYSVEINSEEITGRTDGKIQKITVITRLQRVEVYRLEDFKCQ